MAEVQRPRRGRIETVWYAGDLWFEADVRPDGTSSLYVMDRPRLEFHDCRSIRIFMSIDQMRRLRDQLDGALRAAGAQGGGEERHG